MRRFRTRNWVAWGSISFGLATGMTVLFGTLWLVRPDRTATIGSQAAAEPPTSRIGQIVVRQRREDTCRHIAFDNDSGRMQESDPGPCHVNSIPDRSPHNSISRLKSLSDHFGKR
jgi:hypothetical protein